MTDHASGRARRFFNNATDTLVVVLALIILTRKWIRPAH